VLVKDERELWEEETGGNLPKGRSHLLKEEEEEERDIPRHVEDAKRRLFELELPWITREGVGE